MGENKSQGILIAAAVLLVAGLGGWLAYLMAHPRAPFPPAPVSEQSLVSPKIDIDVYIDGSESIWHFLNNSRGSTGVSSGKTNYLRHFLDHLETTLNPQTGAQGVGWNPANIRAWKFGEYKDPHGRNGSAMAVALDGGPGKLTEAPEKEFDASRTPIEVAVKDEPDPGSPAELRIIITDLYQTDYRVGEYEKPLADKYLADGAHAVEIFAIRNPFDGEVEDLPGSGERTLHNAADTMPFYVIVAGLAPDVRRAREAFLTTADDGIVEALRDHQAIEMLFAKEPGVAKQNPPVIEVPSRPSPRDKSKIEEWKPKANDGKASYVVVGDQAGITEVTVRKSGMFLVSWDLPPIDSSAGHVDTMGRSTSRSDSPLAVSEGANLPLEVHAFVSVKKSQDKQTGQDKASKGKRERFEVQEVPGAAAAVSLSCGGARPFPCAVVDNSHLPKGRYLFRFDVAASKPAPGSADSVFESRSPLMRNWNVEKDAAEGISASSRPVFPPVAALSERSAHPGMTPQLAEFLHALQETVFNSPTHLVSYYLYVEAK